MDLVNAKNSQLLEGNIDLVTRERLQLWAWYPEEPEQTVKLDVYINKIHIGQFVADQYRQDLADAGKGDGKHGLDVEIKSLTLAYEAQSNLDIELFTLAPNRTLIGTRRLAGAEMDLDSIDGKKLRAIRGILSPLMVTLSRQLSASPPSGVAAALHPSFDRVFNRVKAGASASSDEGSSTLAISEYAEFVRYRFRVETRYQTELGKIEINNYLKWYLESYCAMRGETRAPLAAYEIDYLNELVVVGGQRFHLSRVTYMFLFDNPGLLASLNLNLVDSYLAIAYWWAIERARSMFIEDCLVPAAYKSILLSLRSDWLKRPYPLSRFMEIYFSRYTNWHFLDMELEEDRVLLYVGLMLTATKNPSILEYIPKSWLYQITAPVVDREPLLRRVFSLLFGNENFFAHDCTYDEIMRVNGFDLYGCRSLSLSESRHRLFAASLPRPPASQNPRHIQIIGPMRLASGLGQAARLSANAMSKTEFSHSACPFDLDNPAPVGFASDVLLGEMVCPGINLIHLNAESIPLAFTYLPDIFSESYNIGYFFWELDSPAKCHMLGVNLLDEIWVSSEYGVNIYSPYTDKPVINVGMAIEAVTPVDRTQGKLFLQQRTGIQSDEFTFMAAFDSFSFIQRKNPQAVVRAFKIAFSKGERVRLLLKTHNKDFVGDPAQLRVWQALSEEVESDPRIVLLNETLTYNDLICLKCGCDAYVSLHRSEGWGFGMAEAMNLGVPVIATGYSGNMEFCRPETCWLVSYKMKSLGADDYIFVVPGQQWAEPDVSHAAQQMRAVYVNPSERVDRAAAAKEFIKRNFSPEAVGARYAARLNEIMTARGLLQQAKPARRKTK